MGSLFVLFFKYLQMNEYFVNASLFLTISWQQLQDETLSISNVICQFPAY